MVWSVVARMFSSAGARVLVSGRTAERIEKVPQETGGLAHAADATDPDEVTACFDAALAWSDRIDGVVNCAGSVLLKSAHLTTSDEFQEALATNLHTAFNVVRAGANAACREDQLH